MSETAERIEKILRVLGSRQRLQIVEYLLQGISNTDEIAKRLSLSKPTTMQHMNILLEAQIAEKSILSDQRSHQAIRYRINDDAKELVKSIQEACHNFMNRTPSANK
jgi:DNA-binding transcriptional ArsR family regulator